MEEPIFPHLSPKTAAVVVTPQNLVSITIDKRLAHQRGTGAALNHCKLSRRKRDKPFFASEFIRKRRMSFAFAFGAKSSKIKEKTKRGKKKMQKIL